MPKQFNIVVFGSSLWPVWVARVKLEHLLDYLLTKSVCLLLLSLCSKNFRKIAVEDPDIQGSSFYLFDFFSIPARLPKKDRH